MGLTRTRRWHPILSLGLAALTLSVLTPEASADPHRSAQECAATLDCTAVQIDSMPIGERLAFVRAMEAGPGQRIEPGFDRWRNIEGVLEFFVDHGWGESGTWVSDVDGAIIEGAERGLAIAVGRGSDTFGNPGAAKWASYLSRLRDGDLTTRAQHDAAWGAAEQTSTDWGTTTAARLGHEPTRVQRDWYQFTQLYRFMLRNRPAALDLIGQVGRLVDPDLAAFSVPFYDWLTDVRTDVPAHRGGELFYQLVQAHAVRSGATVLELMIVYLPVAYHEFCTETGQCADTRVAVVG